MKCVVTHSCGHTESVELFGKSADRERRAAWLEAQPCAECRADARWWIDNHIGVAGTIEAEAAKAMGACK